jgi:hypothetical protein
MFVRSGVVTMSSKVIEKTQGIGTHIGLFVIKAFNRTSLPMGFIRNSGERELLRSLITKG